MSKVVVAQVCLVLGALAVAACGDDSSDAGQCKSRCDSLKFFDCYDGQALADCRAACDAATAEQRATFDACSSAVTQCDETCWPTMSGNGGHGNGEVTPTSCPSVPCASDEECVKGLCSPKVTTTETCDPNALGEGRADGCASDALCIAPEGGGAATCREFPPCGPNGTCPVSTEGATCSTGLVSNKDAICLPGVCRNVNECPSSWRCVMFFGNFGGCSSGADGMPCLADGDCNSGTCESFGGFGVCGFGEGGATAESCKEKCDDLAFFDCFDGGEQVSCRNGCDQLDTAGRENFEACAQSTSECDASCWFWQE